MLLKAPLPTMHLRAINVGANQMSQVALSQGAALKQSPLKNQSLNALPKACILASLFDFKSYSPYVSCERTFEHSQLLFLAMCEVTVQPCFQAWSGFLLFS